MARKAMNGTGVQDLVGWAARLSPAGWIFVAAGGALLAGLVFYAAWYLPYTRERVDLAYRMNLLEHELAARQADLEKHRAVAETQGAIQAASQYLQNYLFHENEMPLLAQIIEEVGVRAGLAPGDIRFTPRLPALVRENYAEIPFTLSLQGDFPAVLNFLYDFSRLDRLVNITDMEINAPRMAEASTGSGRVMVSCDGRTYRPLTADEEALF